MKIEKIEIKNFKSLKNIEIRLNNLTLITGVNSSGKSSFIQTLLLLKQNSLNKKDLIMEGHIRIADIKSILYEEAQKDDNIEISLFNQDKFSKLSFNLNSFNSDINLTFNLFLDSFQYITTDRVSPKKYYLMSRNIENDLIGFKGEYTAHYLNRNKNNKIKIDALRHSNAITDRLIESVSLWLSEIGGNIEISTKIYLELQIVRLIYNYTYKTKRTEDYTPLNVGFGITYVLPIIVAILKAKKGDLVIIENPESHLHPAGQSKIAELCAIASANGVQIILETHSDHILNGIMIATKNKILKANESKIYFFKKEKGELETKIDELNINSEGKIDKWPKDFFDQYENDMMELL